MSDLTLVHTGVDFGEGPRWRDGRLWFSDFYRRGVFTLADGVETCVLTLDDRPSGLGWMPDDTMLVVSMTDRRVMSVGPDGDVSVHADLAALATGFCNDMVVAADGTAYVGNFGFDLEGGGELAPASLIGVRPDGEVFVAADDLLFPNGAVITADDTTLIVGETFGRRYTAFSIAPDGTLGDRRVWADLDGAPDGCCLDAEGAIWFADPAGSRVARVREGGKITDSIATPSTAIACMLGGGDGRTLHVFTSPSTDPDTLAGAGSSCIHTVRVAVRSAGRP